MRTITAAGALAALILTLPAAGTGAPGPAEAVRAAEPGARIGAVRIARSDPRFAAAALRLPGAGARVAVLARSARGWRVLDLGPRTVGCGLMGDRALRELGLACPAP
ncbi:MAG: hypothetical protein MUE51_03495 [Thermoleophilia bacterium]|jgi:hypothetical protein|nr:hypothetical protein [Thermoleophilia bacterium]